MKISDIIPNQGKVDIEGSISEISEVKEFSKFGKTGRVATAIVIDDSGKIALTLWDEQVELVKKGDKVKIINAYCKEWQGEKQLNLGRYGNIDVNTIN
jgi:replication factor A1